MPEENINIDTSSMPIKTSFWDFKLRKIYINSKEKYFDFFVGLFVPTILGLGLWMVITVINAEDLIFDWLIIFQLVQAGIIIVYISLCLYLLKRRKYISYGLITALIAPYIVSVLLAIYHILFVWSGNI